MSGNEQLNNKQWGVLSSNQEWIRFSDMKAVLLITAFGVIGTIVYSNARSVLEGMQHSGWTILFSVLAIVLGAISCYFAFKCLDPILRNNNPHSLVYFGHIQAKYDDFKAYHKDLVGDTRDTFSEALSEQIFVTSKIAWKKFKRFAIALRFFFASMISASLAVALYLIL